MKYFVDNLGKYLGGFSDDAILPIGTEVPIPPDDARQIWNGNAWGANPGLTRYDQLRALDIATIDTIVALVRLLIQKNIIVPATDLTPAQRQFLQQRKTIEDLP